MASRRGVAHNGLLQLLIWRSHARACVCSPRRHWLVTPPFQYRPGCWRQRGRRTASCPAGLAQQADPHHRAIHARRLHRSDGAAGTGGPAKPLAAIGHCRQQARCQQHHWGRHAGQIPRRWQHLCGGDCRLCRQHHALPQAAVRPAQRPGGGIPDGGLAVAGGSQQRCAL